MSRWLNARRDETVFDPSLAFLLPTEKTSQTVAMGLEVESRSSIESEPRTLTFDQLQYAREAALYVLNTKTVEEAITIFTEGLQPVLIVKGMKNLGDLDDDAGELDHFSRREHLSRSLMKDIVSSPF